MPVWIQYIIWVAAVITGGTIILGFPFVVWRKVLRPGARLVAITEEMLPLLRDINKAFKNTPHAFDVLDEIVDQFRTDSGSSLKDQVNRLEAAAVKQEASAQTTEANVLQLKVVVEAMALRAKDEREQTQRLVLALDRLTVKLDDLTIRVDEGAATGARIEQQASAVADDLAAAHKRADEVSSEYHGAAADASAQQTAKEQLTQGTERSS